MIKRSNNRFMRTVFCVVKIPIFCPKFQAAYLTYSGMQMRWLIDHNTEEQFERLHRRKVTYIEFYIFAQIVGTLNLKLPK